MEQIELDVIKLRMEANLSAIKVAQDNIRATVDPIIDPLLKRNKFKPALAALDDLFGGNEISLYKAYKVHIRQLKAQCFFALGQEYVGKKVLKPSGKPFKSTLKMNTVKEVVNHPVIGVPAFKFHEDDSIVDVRNVKLADDKISVQVVFVRNEHFTPVPFIIAADYNEVIPDATMVFRLSKGDDGINKAVRMVYGNNTYDDDYEVIMKPLDVPQWVMTEFYNGNLKYGQKLVYDAANKTLLQKQK